jgi:hypothetical protein
MHVVQTAGPPPNHGRIKRAISGWTRKSRQAPQKIVRLKANMVGYVLEPHRKAKVGVKKG